MICEDIRAAMAADATCEETEAGAVVTTHCLYPSFERVRVYVSRFGDGYRVSDAGGAARCAWDHGRDTKLSTRLLGREAARYSLTVSDHALVAEASSHDWLYAAILAVANASAAVAHTAVGKSSAASEAVLRDKIFTHLTHVFSPKEIGSDFEVAGKSGDLRHFDYGVRASNDNLLLLSAVAPHHSSIYAKYVAFADTSDLGPNVSRFAVYDRALDRGDASLLLQVAELVPIASLEPGARRAVGR